jgi:lipopolysaccharide/colanic/teichoic acid biosynthesis glycosyltransferase
MKNMLKTTKKYNEINSDQIQQINRDFYLKIKRLADIVMSSTVLLLTAPIMLVLIILIKLESKGPAFFTQERVGKDGKIINIYKLRTMYINHEELGGGVRTEQDDPRITGVGKVIRGCSLDEFPQFFNILKGDMSYIGPRPISVAEHNIVMNDFIGNIIPPQGLIHRVTPGITGWALLHGREQISYKDRFRLNAEYENNISMMFDLKIFYLTFKKYLFTNLCVMALFVIFAGFVAFKIF